VPSKITRGLSPFREGTAEFVQRDSSYGEKTEKKTKQRLRLLVKRFEFDGRMDFCHSKKEKCTEVKRPFLFKA